MSEASTGCGARRGIAMKAKLLWSLATVAMLGMAAPATAQETIKIAFIDPLSGGGASTGEAGLKTFQFIADQLNAKGGVPGKRIEIVGYDNEAQSARSPSLSCKRRSTAAPASSPRAKVPRSRPPSRTSWPSTTIAIPAGRCSISTTRPSTPCSRTRSATIGTSASTPTPISRAGSPDELHGSRAPPTSRKSI